MSVSAYQRLLTEAGATQIGLLEVGYYDGSSEETGLFTDALGGYNLEPGESSSPGYDGRLESGLDEDSGLDSGDTLGGAIGAETASFLLNNADGALDGWGHYLVSGRTVRYLLVGFLADGTRVTYAEASASPLFVGLGVGKPLRGESRVRIVVQGDLYRLRKLVATRLYSPPCPRFPGTTAGCIDFGNNFNSSGAFTWRFWINADNPNLTSQTIFSKDTGVVGYSGDLGSPGNGALRFTIRNQTPPTTDTPANTIRRGQDHEVDFVWDPATSTRSIYVDGFSIASTAGVAGGSPGSNSASFKVGSGFQGRIARGALASSALTTTQSRADMFVPMLDSAYAALPLMEEGVGTSTADNKVGSSVTGSLGTGVAWATSTYCGSSLVGKRKKVVLGKGLDVPLDPIDPGLGIYATSYPAPVAPPTVRSSHNALTSGVGYNYGTDGRGLVTLTGSPSGTYSADIPGETMFSGAVLLDGVSGYASGTVPTPAGTMFMACLVRLSSTSSLARRIMGWIASVNAGLRLLTFTAAATNQLQFGVRNDANVGFGATYSAPLDQDRDYHVCGVLDPGANEMRLYVDAVLVATTAVSGTWNTVTTAFAAGRRSDIAADYLPGRIDEMVIGSYVPPVAEIEELMTYPTAATAGRTQIWHCDEGSGTSLTNSVGGGATLTLAGTYSWAQSRVAAADLINVLLTRYAAYSVDELDCSTIAAFIRANPADCQWIIDDDSTCRDVAEKFLVGTHSWLRVSPQSLKVQMSQVDLPAAYDHDLTQDDLRGDVIEPAEGPWAEAAYMVILFCARNWTPIDADQVATILNAQPERARFATEEWREAPAVDLSILEDDSEARVIRLETPFCNVSDALLEAERVLPFYSLDRQRLQASFFTSALGVPPGDRIRLTFLNALGDTRLGLDAPGIKFLALGGSRVNRRATLRLLA